MNSSAQEYLALPPIPESTRTGQSRLFWRRALAVVIDALLLCAVGIILSALFFEPLVRLGDWTRLIGAMLALSYLVPLDARGATLGKKLVGLRVIRVDGQVPGTHTALIRNLVRLGPWFLIGAWMPWPGLVATLTSALPFAFYVASVLLVAFDRTHRAPHDFAASTRVVSVESQPCETAPSEWRTAVLSAAPFAIALLAAIPVWKPRQLEPLERVLDAILTLPIHQPVSVNDNTIHGPKRKVRTLDVSATFRGPAAEVPIVVKQIVEKVRASGIDLSPYEALRVTIGRGPAFGLGWFTKGYSDSFPIVGGTVGPPMRNYPQLAAQGPVTWSINGRLYEVRTYFVETRDRDGSPSLFYVVEWNCPSCDPNQLTERRAQQLASPVFKYICDAGAWRRYTLASDRGVAQAGHIAVEIVDPSIGTVVHPRYGIVKKMIDACRP